MLPQPLPTSLSKWQNAPWGVARWLLPIVAVVCLLLAPRMQADEPTTLQFAGYKWTTRVDTGMPGPNRFAPANAFVDADGALHLRIARQPDGSWSCGEVLCASRLHFGTYDFAVEGPVSHMDPNVVLGMFTYPTKNIGGDGTNEIDIELSHWGNARAPVVNWTVYPVTLGLGQKARTARVAFASAVTFHRFVWTKTAVSFSDYDAPTPDPAHRVADWDFAPADPEQRIAQKPMQFLINLWLNDGKAPADGQTVEFKILGFHYTPAVE